MPKKKSTWGLKDYIFKHEAAKQWYILHMFGSCILDVILCIGISQAKISKLILCVSGISIVSVFLSLMWEIFQSYVSVSAILKVQ